MKYLILDDIGVLFFSMCLTGQRVNVQSIPADLVNFSGQDNDTPDYQEEIIAQDGDYEDVIATDRST